MNLKSIRCSIKFNDYPAKTGKGIINFTSPLGKLFGNTIKNHKNINILCPKNPINNYF